ncbi:hypothetical protein [Thermovenabulum gondwanense]|uniref:Uncharacterized protein n=1 Tax=Thermovenabulum gondwanense TaxID=520767 RepID=A0A162M7S7_9FIRM|nr:hypothetical protein [Thermovenabulum gondwanense]KYO64477.1 hypothetical protein ATZ99_19050 [Thermovenabulum gondwanense]
MLLVLFNLLKKFLSLFFTGIVIKLMDDYLDEDKDNLTNSKNLTHILKKGILPYSLLLFSLAIIADINYSISIFMSSYITGMLYNVDVKSNLGITFRTEIIVVLLVGVFAFGVKEMCSSIFLIASVQLLDDYIDYETDKPFKKGFAWKLGKTECLMVFIFCVLISLYLDYLKTIFSYISLSIILYFIRNYDFNCE